MEINFKNSSISGNGVAFSVPKDGSIKINVDGCNLDRNGTVLEVRDPVALYAQLGIPADLPPEHFQEAIHILEQSRDRPLEQRVEQVRESRMGTFLQTGSNLATIVSAIISVLPR